MKKEKVKLAFGTLHITTATRSLIVQALKSERLTSGRLVRRFETQYAEKVGTKYAVAVSSGTSALTVALAALYDYGAVRGGKVVMPALTFPATANAVLAAGFVPVFVDVDRPTLTININGALVAARDIDVQAVLPVHLMGKVVDVTALKQSGLPVIEDAAEAHGGKLNLVNAGAMGCAGAFSLYAAHIISTIDGGIVTTNDESMAAAMRSLRADGRACNCEVCIANRSTLACKKRWVGGTDRRFRFDRVGFSCKMNEIGAAVGLGALDEYDEIIEKRHANLMAMIEVVDSLPHLETIHEAANERIGPHAMPIIVKEGAPFTRDDLAKHLVANRIDCRNLFVSIPTQTKAYAWMNLPKGSFPNAEYLGSNGVHIGVHQDINPSHVAHLAKVLAEFLKSR